MTTKYELEKEVDNLSKGIELAQAILEALQKLENMLLLRKQSPQDFILVMNETMGKKKSNTEYKRFLKIIGITPRALGVDFVSSDEVNYVLTKGNDAATEGALDLYLPRAIARAKEAIDNLQQELNKKELELIAMSDGNPLKGITFGDPDELEQLFATDPKDMINRISSLIVGKLMQKKKSPNLYKKGDMHWRRTMNSAMQNDGIPYELKYRARADSKGKSKPRVYVILDTSGSCESFIPLIISMGYAFIEALKGYEIVLYSSVDAYHFHDSRTFSSLNGDDWSSVSQNSSMKTTLAGLVKGFDVAETRNLQGHIPLDSPGYFRGVNRFTVKSLSASSHTPQVLKSQMNVGSMGTNDALLTHIMLLVNNAPENSIFLCFGDSEPRTSYWVNEYLKNPKFCKKLKSFENNIFFFNVMTSFNRTCTTYIPTLSSNKRDVHAIIRETMDPEFWVQPCPQFKVPKGHLYPNKEMHGYPSTYDEWLDNIVNLLVKSLV